MSGNLYVSRQAQFDLDIDLVTWKINNDHPLSSGNQSTKFSNYQAKSS